LASLQQLGAAFSLIRSQHLSYSAFSFHNWLTVVWCPARTFRVGADDGGDSRRLKIFPGGS
jgi:hypothetical protein